MSIIAMSSNERTKKYNSSKRELEGKLNELTVMKARRFISNESNHLVEYLKDISRKITLDDEAKFKPNEIEEITRFTQQYDMNVLNEVKGYFDAEVVCLTENAMSDGKQLKEFILSNDPDVAMRTAFNGYSKLTSLFDIRKKIRDFKLHTKMLEFCEQKLQQDEMKNLYLNVKDIIDEIISSKVNADDGVFFDLN
jgi:hypothetical protein